MVSHMRLWEECIDLKKDIVILEHDALFTNKFVHKEGYMGNVIGLNDPRGMTRKSGVFHDLISKQVGIQEVLGLMILKITHKDLRVILHIL